MKSVIEQQINKLGGLEPFGPEFIRPTQEQIVSIEKQLGTKLPEDYRDFLQTYGTSSFEKMVEFKTANSSPLYTGPVLHVPHQKGGLLQFFYGFSGEDRSLDDAISTYTGRMPESIFPIADDGMDNQICLGIKGKELGKVFYWEHEFEWDEEYYLEDCGKTMPPEVKFQNVYLIANSFEEFILKLEVVNDS